MLEAIGFRPADAPEALGEAVRWFERRGTQVHLIVTEGATVPVLGHSAFVAEPFDGVVGALRASGFEVEEARELWGERRAFVIGPGGHRLELMAAPPN